MPYYDMSGRYYPGTPPAGAQNMYTSPANQPGTPGFGAPAVPAAPAKPKPKDPLEEAADRAIRDAKEQARAAQLSIEQGIARERAIQMVRESQEQQARDAPDVSVELGQNVSGKERTRRRARFFSSPSANVTL